MTTHTMSFRGHTFVIQEGTTHPAYSVDCFKDDGEEGAFRLAHWHPQPGEVVVDVGASYGAYALTAAACGAYVVAFEPEPTVLVDLERNIAANDFAKGGSPRCYAFGVGLWDSNEDAVDMYSFAPNWPPGTISAPFSMRTLDSFKLWEWGCQRVDHCKVDVEGCEERVLRGALETLKRCKPVVIVEAHTFLDPEVANKCQAVLREAGYDRFEWIDRPPCVMVIGRPEVSR